MDRWRRWRLMLMALVALALVLTGAGIALVRAQERSREELADRFALRGTLGARFTESYVEELLASERRRGQKALEDRVVTRADFDRAVDALGFQAALLLDSEGRLIHGYPRDPAPSGTPIAGRYEHLRAAVAGRTAVSGVVPSAADAIPVVAFATPFPTRAGELRVFSGAFALEQTPLATYLRNALPLAGSRLYIIDGAGTIVVASASGEPRRGTLQSVDASLAAAIRTRDRGTAVDPEGDRFFVVTPVRSTPWRLVVSSPEAQLFAPVSGFTSWAPWLLFAAFALACVAVAVLLVRLTGHRARLVRANEDLAFANDELKELDRLKDEFVALVSHELRTPLTSVIGYIRLLLRGRAGELEPEQRRLLGVADRNAHRLLRLVGDLLFAAKADAGELLLQLGDEDLATIVTQAAETAAPAAREREIELVVKVSHGLPVVADGGRMVQLLDNLLSNAVKFSRDGGTVHVRAWSANGEAVIEVADSGIGIPAQEQDRLFERFFRASTATEREIQGTGLGLSVAKTIVELHGGRISCASREGEGTTFRVALPLAEPQAAVA